MDKNLKDFPEDLNTKLRIEAIKRKMTVKDLIIDLLRKALRPTKAI